MAELEAPNSSTRIKSSRRRGRVVFMYRESECTNQQKFFVGIYGWYPKTKVNKKQMELPLENKAELLNGFIREQRGWKMLSRRTRGRRRSDANSILFTRQSLEIKRGSQSVKKEIGFHSRYYNEKSKIKICIKNTMRLHWISYLKKLEGNVECWEKTSPIN